MNLAVKPDDDLVILARCGDESAFAELLARHDGRAFQVALNSLRGNRDDAEDAMQNVRVACWQSIHKYDPEKGAFSDWLFGIVRQCCIALYKQRQRTVDWIAHDDVEHLIASPLEQLIDRDARSYIAGAIDALPTQQSQAVRMRYLEGCEYAAIAETLAIPEATVRSNVRFGLANLRQRLDNKWALWAPQQWAAAK